MSYRYNNHQYLFGVYRGIDNENLFNHLTVNHSLNFISPENLIVHTLNIENCSLMSKKAKNSI